MGFWRGALVSRLLRALAYNPFSNLYLSLVSQGDGIPGYVTGEGYINLLHQVDLYTELLVRDPARLLIADEIGLGKTVEALRFVKLARHILGAKLVLVAVPASLLVQWREGDARALGVPMHVIDRSTIGRLWDLYKHLGTLPEGVYIGSMDTLKLDSRRSGSPYYELVSSVRWDAVIVDEAHKLSRLGGKPSLRYKRVGELCLKARHCILLTATPTRGDAKDLLSRLALLEPRLKTDRQTVSLLGQSSARSARALRDLRDYLIRRRTKEHLRLMEGDTGLQVPDARFLLGLVKLSPAEEKFYSELYSTVGAILRALGARQELGLLRALLVKRALSSPYGFLRTLDRIVRSKARVERWSARVVESLLFEDEVEPPEDLYVEPDRLEEGLLADLRSLLSPSLLDRLARLRSMAESMMVVHDSPLHVLSLLLTLNARGAEVIEGEKDSMHSNMLVFTEYKDTLDYLRRGIRTLLPSSRLRRLESRMALQIAKQHTSADAPWELFVKSTDLYATHGSILLTIYLSSENSSLIPLVTELVRRTEPLPNINVAVLATDVAGEGLNLQGANVLVNYEVTWSMIKREQRIGRVWRIGQRRKVYILDLVRGTRLEKMIYERLLSKIYMLSVVTGEDLKTGPRGMALLHYTRSPDASLYSGIKPVELSSGRVLEGLAGALEHYDDPAVLEHSIHEIAQEILSSLERYRSMARIISLEDPGSEAERARAEAMALYGASSHEEAEEALRRLAEACGLGKPSTLGKALVSLRNRCGTNSGELPVQFVSRAEGAWNMAFLVIVPLERDNARILEIPVLVEYGDESNKIYWGLRAVERLSSHIKHGQPLEGGMLMRLPGPEELREAGMLGGLDQALQRVATRTVSILASRGQRTIWGPASRLMRAGILSGMPERRVPHVGEPTVLAVIYRGGARPGDEAGPGKYEVEEAGIRHVVRLLEERGFYVDDVHREGLPYDLVARPRSILSGEELYVEVKSHRNAVLAGVLTEREARMAEDNPSRYIVCLVGLALSDSPIVVCKPYGEWRREPLVREVRERRVVVHL